MTRIIKNNMFGYYYSGIRPFVNSIGISQTDDIFSLEGESSYKHSNKIGTFTGYPGNFIIRDEFNYGFESSDGFICIDNLKTLIVSNGLILSDVKNNINPQNNVFDDVIIQTTLKTNMRPQCTSTIDYIDINNKLGFETDFDKNNICGIFSGIPGKYVNNINPDGTPYQDRNYGFNLAEGIIILNCLDINFLSKYFNKQTNGFNFEYILDCGVIKEKGFNKYY